MNEQEKINLKIAIRFLKEIGFYQSWKEYLTYCKNENRSLNYDLNFIDSIFCDSNFSGFLQKKGIHIEFVSDIFYNYLLCIFPKHRLKLKYPNLFYEQSSKCLKKVIENYGYKQRTN